MVAARPILTGYAPRLDGLRAISILLVLREHFLWGGGHILERPPARWLSGVTIFFVISGYLITSILLTYSEVFSVKTAAKTFYWRRALRLSRHTTFASLPQWLSISGGCAQPGWSMRFI